MQIQNSLGYLLGASTRLMKKQMNNHLEEYDITTSQWAVLKLLAEKKQLTQKQISDELSGDKATAGEIIKLLYKKGYIEKVVNTLDKRAFNINLTPKAQGIVKEIEIKSIDVIECALKGLDGEETELLLKMLKQIIANLSEEMMK